MKNVTISMDDSVYRESRINAAKAGLSLSRYFAEAAKEKNVASNENQKQQERNIQLEAIDAFLSGPKWQVMENGRMPTADERNARR